MIEASVFVADGMINSELLDKEKQIYILSTNTNAKKIFFKLLQYQIKVLGFITEKETSPKDKLYGLKIFSLEDVKEKNTVYISDKDTWDIFKESIQGDKIYFIDSDQFIKNEFIFMENGELRKCNAALMLTMILSRAQKKQSIFLINSQEYGFWNNLVNVMADEIISKNIICIDTEMEKIYDIMYCDLENILIFVCVFNHKEVTDILIELGLKQTYHFVYIHNSFSGHVTDKYYGFDWYLGNSFLIKEKFPGFYIHGDINSGHKKIVLLGNSATDPLFYPQKSWPEMLWENCKKYQIDITIYNGAVTDYNSTNEVIKLFRDVLLLKPDIVVSYSGIIDFRQYVPNYPYINLNLMRTSQKWEEENKKEVIFGLEDKRSAYERWIDNEKIMHQLCEMQGIVFYGVLQPWIGSESKNACEKLQVWSDNYWQVSFPQFDKFITNASEFKKRIKIDVEKNNWLYDFTNIFMEIDDSDIYFDSIHVNEKGNEIVAKQIGALLMLFNNRE